MEQWASDEPVLGKYTVLHPLGRGGMAEVQLARTSVGGVERLVAVKRMRPEYTEETEFVRMFRNEAKVTTMLEHPNIVRVLDYGESNGEHFLVLEYVHGVTLRQLLKDAGKVGGIPLACVLYIVKSVAAGLHAAHELCDELGRPMGVVHRDVSPSNVLIGYDGSVRVSDFGVARAYLSSETRSGSLKGKVPYMSPEQCEGEKLDRRSDIFSTGILLYEASVGRRMFTGINEFQIMNAIARGHFVRPTAAKTGYPPELEEVLLRAVQVDPQNRYATMEEFELALEDVAVRREASLSPINLRKFVESCVGPQPYPTARTVSEMPLHSKSRRGPLVAVTAALALAGMSALWGVYAVAKSPQSLSPVLGNPLSSVEPGDEARATAQPAPPEPVAAAELARDARPGEDEAEAEAEASEVSDDDSRAPRRKRKQGRRRRASDRAGDSDARPSKASLKSFGPPP